MIERKACNLETDELMPLADDLASSDNKDADDPQVAESQRILRALYERLLQHDKCARASQ